MLHCWSESIAYTYQTNATLQQLYRDAKIRHETDPEFALEAKRALVLLQSGQAGLDVWQALVNTSLEYFKQTYSRLGLDVDYSTWFMGESAYQSHMPSLLDSDLIKSCVYGGEEGNDQSIVSTNGVVLRKSDGSIGYDATDVAALLHRAQFSDQILYVVDAGQASHFDKIFDFVRPVIGHVDPVHVKFGLVCRQGEGKIKTREGHSPSLVGLLNDAKEVTKQKLFGCSETLAEHCGTASVCFAELKTNRIQNYEFSLDRVCNPDGDGAMYLFYVLAKLQRQRQHSMLSNSSNRKLQVLVCKFHDVLEQVLVTHSPHHLCLFLLQLAQETSSALDNQNGDLLLLQAVEHVLIQGMRLVGISQSNWSTSDRDFLLEEKHRKRKV